MKTGTFRQISTDLWPCVDNENSFPISILSIFFYQFSSNFVLELTLGKSAMGLHMALSCQITTELWPSIYVQNCIFSISFENVSCRWILIEFCVNMYVTDI